MGVWVTVFLVVLCIIQVFGVRGYGEGEQQQQQQIVNKPNTVLLFCFADILQWSSSSA
jgi:amino acid permease